MRLTAVVARMRAAGPRAVLRALVPRRVDELLYGVDASVPLPPSTCPVAVEIHRYDEPTTGDPAIDRRLDGRRACFLARVDGRVAHQSWLHFDTVLPSLFGHDAAPVIGDCVTDAAFRGLHLYPHMLVHIVHDVRARAGDGARATSGMVHVLVSPDNNASIRGIERAGFRLIARLRGLRVGPLVLRRPFPRDASGSTVAATRTRAGSA